MDCYASKPSPVPSLLAFVVPTPRFTLPYPTPAESGKDQRYLVAKAESEVLAEDEYFRKVLYA